MPILRYNNYYAAMTSLAIIPFVVIMVWYAMKIMRRVSNLAMRKWLFKAEIAMMIVTGLVNFIG